MMTTHERAKKAAAARWGGARKSWKRIYVDADVADALSEIRPKAKQREIASDAIRREIRSRRQ